MLTFTASNDRELLDTLSLSIFGSPFGAEVGFILYEDESPIGVARLVVTPETSVLEKVGILSEKRGLRYGDFFTRSLLNGASYASKEIEIAYESDYFLKFGFIKGGKGMKIKSEKLVFPCECGKKQE